MMKLLTQQTKFCSLLNLLFVLSCLNSNGQGDSLKLDLSEQLFNCTIRIEGIRDSIINGKVRKVTKVGTGFFYATIVGKDTIKLIVSNKHTIEKCKEGVLKFNTNKNGMPEYGNIQSITLDNFEKLWLFHPSEDLAVLPLYPIEYKLAKENKKLPFYTLFLESLIPSDSQEKGLSALEEVLMIGYPKGFYDVENNLPIIRRGITASPVYINYNKKRQFLLDIPIYSGSSGSPIVIYNQNGYTDKNGGAIFGNTRFFLIGVAMESREYEAKGRTISNNPSNRLETSTSLPFGIAIVIKSSTLLDFKPILEKAVRTKSYTDLFAPLVK